MASRVTNADLAAKLDALNERMTVIETEAKVAKWVLRVLGAFFATIAAAFIRGFVKHQ